jgi:hypothetical protein
MDLARFAGPGGEEGPLVACPEGGIKSQPADRVASICGADIQLHGMSGFYSKQKLRQERSIFPWRASPPLFGSLMVQARLHGS